MSLFIVTGVSGSGKTNISKKLRLIVGADFDAYDMDLIVEDYDKFEEMGKVWLKIAHWNAARGKNTILCGSFPDYRLTNHELYREFQHIYYCYLTCSDEVRTERLAARGGAWTIENIQIANEWDHFLKEKALHCIRPISVIDTTSTTVDSAAEMIWEWATTLSNNPMCTNYGSEDPWNKGEN
jgi:gluconate kinase